MYTYIDMCFHYLSLLFTIIWSGTPTLLFCPGFCCTVRVLVLSLLRLLHLKLRIASLPSGHQDPIKMVYLFFIDSPGAPALLPPTCGCFRHFNAVPNSDDDSVAMLWPSSGRCILVLHSQSKILHFFDWEKLKSSSRSLDSSSPVRTGTPTKTGYERCPSTSEPGW